jgi:hypothetical protein
MMQQQPSGRNRTNELVERAARDAQRAARPKSDLFKDGVPFRPGLWNILVEPIEPKQESEGGIVLAAISQEAEAFQITIGRVLKVGPACMEGKTTSGIELCNFLPGITKPEHLLGKYFVYQLHTGMSMTLRKTGQRVIVMKVTDLLGDTEDPEAWKFYV